MAGINTVKYKYKLEMSFVNNSQITKIPSEAIKLLMIDYDYMNTDGIHAPIAVATVNIETAVYNEMQANKNNGKILLKVSKYKDTDTNPVPITYFEKQLKYSFPDGEFEYEKDGSSKGDGGEYRKVSLVMIASDDVDRNRLFKNNNYCSINTMTVIRLLCTSISFVIEPFEKNPTTRKAIPPMESVHNLLLYLNYYWNFYKGGYRYFQNWDDTGYILSYKGTAINVGDGTYPTVKIKVSKQHDTLEGNIHGMGIGPGYYIIEVDADNEASTMPNDATSGRYNQLYCTMSNGRVVSRPLNIHNNVSDGKMKVMKLSTNDADVVENIATELEASGTIFSFTKAAVDTSLLVPYKQFIVENIEEHSKESGMYLLASKKETYAQDGDGFYCSVLCSLKKVPQSK